MSSNKTVIQKFDPLATYLVDNKDCEEDISIETIQKHLKHKDYIAAKDMAKRLIKSTRQNVQQILTGYATVKEKFLPLSKKLMDTLCNLKISMTHIEIAEEERKLLQENNISAEQLLQMKLTYHLLSNLHHTLDILAVEWEYLCHILNMPNNEPIIKNTQIDEATHYTSDLNLALILDNISRQFSLLKVNVLQQFPEKQKDENHNAIYTGLHYELHCVHALIQICRKKYKKIIGQSKSILKNKNKSMSTKQAKKAFGRQKLKIQLLRKMKKMFGGLDTNYWYTPILDMRRVAFDIIYSCSHTQVAKREFIKLQNLISACKRSDWRQIYAMQEVLADIVGSANPRVRAVQNLALCGEKEIPSIDLCVNVQHPSLAYFVEDGVDKKSLYHFRIIKAVAELLKETPENSLWLKQPAKKMAIYIVNNYKYHNVEGENIKNNVIHYLENILHKDSKLKEHPLDENNVANVTKETRPNNNSATFLEHCKNGNINAVKYLLEECKFDINICNNDKNNALHLAVLHNHLVLVKLLINEVSVTQINLNNHMPVDIACAADDKTIEEFFSKYANTLYFRAEKQIKEYGKSRKSLAKVFPIYLKSAALGCKEAQTYVGYLYRKAWGVQKNISQAKFWSQRAFHQGDKVAAYNLGVICDNSKDIGMALYWYALVPNLETCKGEYASAGKRIVVLGKKLQILKGQKKHANNLEVKRESKVNYNENLKKREYVNVPGIRLIVSPKKDLWDCLYNLPPRALILAKHPVVRKVELLLNKVYPIDLICYDKTAQAYRDKVIEIISPYHDCKEISQEIAIKFCKLQKLLEQQFHDDCVPVVYA